MAIIAYCRWRRAVRFVIAALFVGASVHSVRAAAQSWEDREVAIESGGVTLRGSLMLPNGDGPVAAVLFLAGSGPTDRNGNQPQLQNDVLRRLAQGLAEARIASLRIDKRGIGGSISPGMREGDLRFDDYVDDAVRWMEFLRAQPRIGSAFFAGHSEGGLIGIVAAQRTLVSGLVSIAGPGFPIGATLRRQFDAAAGLTPSQRSAANRIIDELEAGRTVSDLPADWAGMFRPSVQPYLISQFRYDPAAELAKLRLPILVMQGDRDLQVSEADAQRLAAAAPKADLVLLHGVNHVLRDVPADRDGNLAAYNRPGEPLAAVVLPALVGFIRGVSQPER